MANLKEIRSRIRSVTSTQQLTKAMKMVAAAKLRRAQNRMFQLRPYSAKLREIIDNVVSIVNPEDIPSPLVKAREVNHILVVVVTSNRGMAGPFNANVIKHATQFLQQHHASELADGRIQFICIGKKGYEYFRKRGYETNGRNFDVFTDLSFEKVNAVVDQVFDKFIQGEVDKVYLVYNEFKNVMAQIRRADTLLPLSMDKAEAADDPTDEQGAGILADYIFEPDREEILKELIPKALRTQVFQAVLESNAAEQGARMVAMDTATENAEELLRTLRLSYNKARQAAITKEIIEISAGADALEG